MYTPRVAEADALFARAAALMRAQGRDQGMSHVATLNNWALGNFLAGQLQTATERHDEMLAAAKLNAGAQGVSPINFLNAATDRLESGRYREALAFYDRETLQAARAWKNAGFAASSQCLRCGSVARRPRGLSPGPALRDLAEPLKRPRWGPHRRRQFARTLAASWHWRGGEASRRPIPSWVANIPNLRGRHARPLPANGAHARSWRPGRCCDAARTRRIRSRSRASCKEAQPESFRTALALDYAGACAWRRRWIRQRGQAG